MSEDLHLGGLSKRTHDGYLRAVRQLADFCKCPPDLIREDQLRKFFLHLKNDKEFASGSLRVAFSGVKFFYTRTCRREWQTLAQMKIQNVKSLPEVLTIEQVHQIIDGCRTQRMAVFFWTVYSLGHSSLQTTMIYLHLTHTAAVDALRVINSLFRRPRPNPPEENGGAVPVR